MWPRICLRVLALVIGKTQNDDIDLTPYGNQGLVKTHSFLYESLFSRVQKAFNSFRLTLQ